MLANGRAAERIETTNRAGIKLSYIPDAKLDELELRRVLWLVQQVGVTNVAKVRTLHGFANKSRLIEATSRERAKGRNISYETVTINWAGYEAAIKPRNAIQSGDFWVSALDKITWLQRTFDIGGTTRRVTLKEKDIPIADKAIPLIAARKVRFRGDFARSGFERVNLYQSCSLRTSRSADGYELWLHDRQEIIYFRIENDEVLITAIGNYQI